MLTILVAFTNDNYNTLLTLFTSIVFLNCYYYFLIILIINIFTAT